MAADVQADGTVQAIDRGHRHVQLQQPLAPPVVVAQRTQGANVEGVGLQRRQQRQVIQPRIVGQGHHRGALVRADRQHGIVRHARDETRLARLPALAEFLAGIADQHLEVEHGGHVGDIERQLTGADQQQPPTRSVYQAQAVLVQGDRLVAGGAGDPHLAGGQVQLAQGQFVVVTALQELLHPTPVGNPLLDQA